MKSYENSENRWLQLRQAEGYIGFFLKKVITNSEN